MITEFGKRLREIRIRKGDTLADMAHRLGVRCSTISDFETGRKNVSKRTIGEIAYLYHLTAKEIDELKMLARTAQGGKTNE